MTNKEAIEELEELVIKQARIGLYDEEVEAIKHAIEVLKRFEGAVEVDIDFDNRIIWAKDINADIEEVLGYPQKVQYYAISKEQDNDNKKSY